MPKEFDRTERVGLQLQKLLAEIIPVEVKDPRMPSLVTVSAVTMSKDLAYAKVYITVFDSKADHNLVVNILNRAAGYLRSCLGKHIRLRVTPELRFIYDDSIEEGNRLSKLIDEVQPKHDDETPN